MIARAPMDRALTDRSLCAPVLRDERQIDPRKLIRTQVPSGACRPLPGGAEAGEAVRLRLPGGGPDADQGARQTGGQTEDTGA